MLNGMYIYWNSCPPVHESVFSLLKGFLGDGSKPKPRTGPTPSRDERATKVTSAASELIGAGFRGVQTKAPDWYKPNA